MKACIVLEAGEPEFRTLTVDGDFLEWQPRSTKILWLQIKTPRVSLRSWWKTGYFHRQKSFPAVRASNHSPSIRNSTTYPCGLRKDFGTNRPKMNWSGLSCGARCCSGRRHLQSGLSAGS